MNKHYKIYFETSGLHPAYFVPCEVCAAQWNCIHHIEARKMGGDPTGSKDCFENLMAICRSCDTKFGDKKQYKPMLYKVHAERFPNILYYDEDAEVAKML